MSKPQVVINLTPPLLLITVALLALKSLGIIDWSLWVCTAPMWVPYAALLAVLSVALLIFLLAALVSLFSK